MGVKETALYACNAETSRGRHHDEPSDPARSPYQRDRDRIIHCGAFRRLEYKTQVFINHEGDLFRTRLTHTIEVAQIARSVARRLKLDEDLTEAVSLAHDLGHTPFGHAGQDALNTCMKDYGGFEHNIQSLRLVDLLEERYGPFNGLNLTFETREGILKHCSLEMAAKLGDVGERFFKDQRPSLEAQIANVADEIAYNNHDVDDGLRSGLLTLKQLEEVDLFAKYWHQVHQLMPDIPERRAVHETVRRMIGGLIEDLSSTSLKRIQDSNPKSVEDVRNLPTLIAFSDEMATDAANLKSFLFKHLYRHYLVNRNTSKARRIVKELFAIFMAEPQLLADEFRVPDGSDRRRARRVADYIAGMTDRYAMRQYRALFEIEDV